MSGKRAKKAVLRLDFALARNLHKDYVKNGIILNETKGNNMSDNPAFGINLTDLFAKGIFRIPDYQRGYAWGERQLIELWQDIEDIEFVGKGEYRSHFTGTIYVEQISLPEDASWLMDHHCFSVVDGQQRLTTISLLMFELWKAISEDFEYKDDMRRDFIVCENKSKIKRVYKFSYIGNQERFLQKEIFEDASIRGEVGTQNVYTRNLVSAKNFFAKKISQLSEEAKSELYLKLIRALRFDFRPINDLDVQAVFETMNNRGKPLTVLEKLKNRLMYLTDKLSNDVDEKCELRTQINDTWGNVYRKLGQNAENILDEDDFISAHLSLYRTPNEPTFSTQLAEKKLFEMFSTRAENYSLAGDDKIREPKVDFVKIQNYIRDLDRFAEYWYDINNSSIEMEQKILVLNRSKELKIFLCALHAGGLDIVEALNLVEKILFRNRVPGAYFKDEGSFATAARRLYNGEEELAVVIDALRLEMAEKPINPANVALAFAALFDYQRGVKGFHRWATLRYFLFEYESHRKIEVKEYRDYVIIRDYDKTSVEHIIPQDYVNWQGTVSSFVSKVPDSMEKGEGYSEKVLINTLGNLMLIWSQKNSSLKNDPWSVKKARYKTGTYNEREVSDYQEWTHKEIAERGHKLLMFLSDKLGIAHEAWTQSLLDQALYNNEQIASAMRI